MQKQTLIGKRVAVWDSLCEFNKRTGEVVKYSEKTGQVDVKLDGDSVVRNYFVLHLYFPHHPMGYNQGCFNQ